MPNMMTSKWITAPILVALALLTGSVGCSPGTLPGSPSTVGAAGGGGRYNGSITVRRLTGDYVLNEASQALTLSFVTEQPSQIQGRFTSGSNSGTLVGTLIGSLAGGGIQATLLVSTSAQQGAASVTCEGRSSLSGTLSGANVTWTASPITYDNCPGLTAISTAQATAVSPIPGSVGNRANVVVSIAGSTTVPLSTCPGGAAGYPFTVDISETAGVDVAFGATFTAEERRGGALSSSTYDMPFIDLPGGGRRTYSACSTTAGTYQAFFEGTDVNGNRFRVASPLVTLGAGF